MCVLVGACRREGRDESGERVGAGGMAWVGEGMESGNMSGRVREYVCGRGYMVGWGLR